MWTRLIRARILRVPTITLLGLTLSAGCLREPVGTGSSRPVRRDPNLLVIYAVCALAPGLELARSEFEAQNPGRTVDIWFGDPTTLVDRVESGGVPDLLICLGEVELGLLQREGFVDPLPNQTIGGYHLVIATPAVSEVRITTPQDLLATDVGSIAMASPGTASIGTDGKKALERLGLWNQLQKKLKLYQKPQEVLEALSQGEVAAAIIYDPCPALALQEALSPDSVVVALPLTTSKGAPDKAAPAVDQERLVYVRAATHKRSPNSGLAQRFVKLLGSEEIKAALEGASLRGQAAD